MAEVGNVWVTVVPSMRGFASKVNAEAKSIGDITVNVTLNVTDAKATNAKIDETAKDRTANVKVDADTKAADAKLSIWQRTVGRFTATANVDTDTGAATGKLVAFRGIADKLVGKITTNVNVDTGAAIAKLTGFAAVAAGVQASTSLAGSAMSATFSLVGLVIATLPGILGVAGAAIAAMPGLIAAAAVPLATVALGMDGIKAAAQSIAPQFAALKSQVSAAFQTGLLPVMHQIAGIFPVLGAGAVQVASALSNVARQVVQVVASGPGLGMIQNIFAQVAIMLNQLAPVFAQLTGTFLSFVNVSVSGLVSTLVPALAAFSNSLATTLDQISASGALGRAAAGFGDLLGAILQLIPPIIALAVNMWDAVGPSVVGLVNSVVAALAPFGQIVMALAPLFNQLAATVGQLLVTALQALVPVFAAVVPPLVQIVSLVGGALAQAITLVAPLVTALVAALGPVLISVLQALLPPLLQVVGALSAALAPVLPVIGAALVSVVNALAPFVSMLGGALAQAITMIAPILGQLAQLMAGMMVQALNTLAPLLPMVAGAFLQLLGALLPLIPIFYQFETLIMAALLPILPIIVTLIVQLVLALLPLVPPLIQLAQTLFPALVAIIGVAMPIIAFLAQLIGTILVFAVQVLVTVIVALVTAFVAVWNAIGTAASFVWTSILMPVFSAIGIAVMAVGAFFVWLWQSVIVPAWTAISTAVSVAWTTVIQPVLSFIGTALAYLGLAIVVLFVTPYYLAWQAIVAVTQLAWAGLQYVWYTLIVPALQFLGMIFTWLWQNIVVPVWNGIVMAISFAWGIIQAIWYGAILPALSFLGSQFMLFWNAIIVPVWNGIVMAISFAWGIIQAIWYGAIVPAIQFVGSIFTWLWVNIVQPVWTGITMAISFAWGIIQGIFNVLKDAVHAVGQAFQDVSDWIGRAWDSIKEAARGPVQWVIDIVYNNGVRTVWNGIAGLFGMAQLGEVHMAQGGVLPGYGPGRDTIPAVLSAGEGVLVPEAVRGLGPAFVGWANRYFSGGRSDGGPGTGFSKGGVAHFADGGVLGDIGGFFSGMGDFLVKALTDPVAAVKDLFANVVGDNDRTPGAGHPWTEAPKQIVPKTIDAVIQKVKDWVASLGAMGAGGNWAPVVLQALAMTGQAASWLPNVLAQIQIESSGNPNAINLTDSNAAAGHPSMGLLQTIITTFDSYAGPLRGLGPFNPLANIYAAIRYTVATYGSLAKWPTRGGYDNGGLASGSGLMMKQTIAPERVLSPRQTMAFESLVPMLSRLQSSSGPSAGDFTSGRYGNDPIVINVYPSERMDEAQLADAVQHRLDWRMGLITS